MQDLGTLDSSNSSNLLELLEPLEPLEPLDLSPYQPEHFVPLLFHELRGQRLQIEADHRLRVRAADVEMPVGELAEKPSSV